MATLEKKDRKNFSAIGILFLLGLGIALWSMKKGTDRSKNHYSLLDNLISDNNRDSTRNKREGDYLISGVILALLIQALYDMMRFYYTQYYPKLPVAWVDLLAALFAITIFWGFYHIRIRTEN